MHARFNFWCTTSLRDRSLSPFTVKTRGFHRRSAEYPHLLDRRLPAERRGLDVIELELPRTPAAPPVLADPGA
jgi:hypothetical protein